MSQKVTHDRTSKFEVPLKALHNAQCKEIVMMSIEYVVLSGQNLLVNGASNVQYQMRNH